MSKGMPNAWSRSAPDLLAEVVMAATNHKGPFLVVEGPTDQRFLELKVDTSIYFVASGGKDSCLALIRLLNSEPRAFPYLGIADEDYNWLNAYNDDNLVLTDTRDLEGILIRSSALDAVIVELADRAKVDAFLQNTGISVREALLAKANFFGRVRVLGYLNGTICLDEVKPARFCGQGWTYDEDACAQVCVNLGLAADKATLMAQANAIDAPSDWHFARGHDLVDILIGGFVHVLSGKAPVRQHVEALLRQSMQRTEFETTALFARVAEWEAAKSQKIWKAA